MRTIFNIFWTLSVVAWIAGTLMGLQSIALQQPASDIALVLFTLGLIFTLICCEIAWGTRKKLPPNHESVRNPDDPGTAYLPEAKKHGK
jgi:hypothetical protein